MHSKPIATRLVVTCLILALIATQTACITKPPSLDLHERLTNQRIALLADPNNPPLSLDQFPANKPQGALKGAGQGIMSFLDGGMGGCSGEYCGAALLLYLAVAVVVGGTIGAIQGAMEASPDKASSGIEEMVRKNLGKFTAHLDLPQRVLAQSREVGGLAIDLVTPQADQAQLTTEGLHLLRQQGFEKAVTMKIERFDFVGDKGEDPKLGLYLEVSTRIFDTASAAEEYHREFHASGKVRRYSEWLRVDSEKLSAELNGYLEQLAGDIVNGLFLSYDLPIDSGSWTFPGSPTYGCCWICPTDPALEISYFPVLAQGWPYVGAQPRLAWRPFPDDRQQAQFQAKIGARADNVRYDLRIWAMPGHQALGRPVYERYALTNSSHQVEDPLEPGRQYLWSVRACFEIAERVACTPWAFSLVPAAGRDGCESTSVGTENFYHFRVR